MSYGYVPHYVTEEPDLSESECPSDEPVIQQLTSDVTELYRRKHQAVNQARNTPGSYYHTHMQGYYEPQRLPTTCACNFPPEPRYCYKGVPQSQEGIFRSTTQLTPNIRMCPEPKTVSTGTIKKYPITARTPRYYRCTATQLCKRPSTLCLPVTCQPDPAVFHRSRKAPPTEIQHYRGQEAAYAINDYVMRTTTAAAVKRTDARPVDSEGDVNSRLNDLETILTKFDDDEDEEENEQVEISGVSDIAKILKPKIPPSLKPKQEKLLKVRAVKTNVTETIATTENVNKLDVKEAPPEPLEILLQRLQTNSPKRNTEKRTNTNEGKEVLQTKPEIASRQKHLFSSEQKPPLDDNSALELHKSKSYIVSLIDKALSKELGTVPGDKCTRREFMNMNPKKAVDMVNRHSASKALEKTINFDASQPGSSKKEDEKGQCLCRNEEPLYLKQLKQLRWSHLRHIQREAKRLADLERFLDSFSEAESAS